MNQREYIFQLENEDKSPNEFQELLHHQYGQQAFVRTEVYEWAGQARIGSNFEYNREPPAHKPDDASYSRDIRRRAFLFHSNDIPSAK